jgi:hypothetical protein
MNEADADADDARQALDRVFDADESDLVVMAASTRGRATGVLLHQLGRVPGLRVSHARIRADAEPPWPDAEDL